MTPTPNPPALLPVIESDREAAALLQEALNGADGLGRDPNKYRDGSWDNQHLVQALAAYRHRLQSLSTPAEPKVSRVAVDQAWTRGFTDGVNAACRTLRDQASQEWGSDEPENIKEWRNGWVAACENIPSTIRTALSNPPADGDGWREISSAPYGELVEVRVAHMTFMAVLSRGASVNDDGQTCDQWVAAYDGEHPPCWSDGACWATNEDEVQSLQPNAWRPSAPLGAGGEG